MPIQITTNTSVRIKNIYIEIPKYEFSSVENSIYIGREDAKDKLKRRIKPVKSEYKGAYLIAGYRGMGKSTLVKKVIDEINEQKDNIKKQPKLHTVNLSLPQNNLSYFDVLRQMFIQFSSAIENELAPIKHRYIMTFLSVLSCLISISIILFTPIKSKFIDDLGVSSLITVLIFSIVFGALYIGINLFFKTFFINKRKHRLIQKIDNINKRVHSSLEISSNNFKAETYSGLGAGTPLLNQTLSLINSNSDNPQKQSFDKISAKELEYELKTILKIYSQLRSTCKVLFIVDELDKLESEFSSINVDDDDRAKSLIETRRESLSRLLANLKSFIHTADAKFVFIGGAEMYAAHLADIADRESFYSSIFHEVIYVNSFFKDYEYDERKGLSQMIESYLIRFLMPHVKFNEQVQPNLKTLFEALDGVREEHKYQVIYHFGKFITYLTYRCNGSPKRLKELIESYTVSYTKRKRVKYDTDIIFSVKRNKGKYVYEELREVEENNLLKKVHVTLGKLSSLFNLKKAKANNDRYLQGTYLKIDYRQQYKVGLLASMYSPHILNNDRHLIIFNDRNLYLSAFLMDHILKFHRSAFSWRELEIVPDIILGNRGPNLRETLEELINYLSKKHIRETSNAMFQFKFRSRTEMELRYISKISDESAAAFNFTYDASYHLKMFFKKKLREKLKLYQNRPYELKDVTYIHTLGYLNSTIADLHYYDEEYDSAIRYYADAIQPLRELMQSSKNLTNHQKVLFTRNRLLLGLCLEKTHRYDSAYSVIRNLIVDLKSWKSFDKKKKGKNHGKGAQWESAFKRMQLFLRPHITLLSIIEKKRSDGITSSNLRRNIDEYREYMELVDLFPTKDFNNDIEYRGFHDGGIDGDHKRIQTLLADYYQNVGSILFYKNRNFKSILEKGLKGVVREYLNVKSAPSSLGGIRRKLCGNSNQKYYFPTFIPTFYYIVSIQHLIYPYIENLSSIYKKSDPNIEIKNHTYVMDKLAHDYRSAHILNGKQKSELGLMVGKLSDCILACLGQFEELKLYLKSVDSLFDEDSYKNWGVKGDKNGKLDFKKMFSLNYVMYLNILSYKFFKEAGRYFDASNSLKKCLYIIKTHLVDFSKYKNNSRKKNKINLINKLTRKIGEEYYKVIKIGELSIIEEENAYYDSAIGTEGKFRLLCTSDEVEEVDFLIKFIKLKINIYNGKEKEIEDMLNSLYNDKNVIHNIFARIQKIRFHSSVIFSYIENSILSKFRGTKNIQVVANAYSENDISDICKMIESVSLCLKNLENIIKTYGYTYIMSYSYMGSLYHNIVKWIIIIDKLSKYFPDYEFEKHFEFRDIELYKRKAIEFFNKAIRLHSGGKEYKLMMSNMYVLEDDQNDSLVHFCAALERSLINTGIIEKKIQKLR